MHDREYRLSKRSLGKSLNKETIIAFIKKQEHPQGGGDFPQNYLMLKVRRSHHPQPKLRSIQKQETMAHSQEK